jgi:hypothetical protein
VRTFLVLISLLLSGCSPIWKEQPYKVYYIDGTKRLGYSLGQGAYIGRLDEPINIKSNKQYISVYACPHKTCAFYYIDKIKDNKFAEHKEFVYGPYTKAQFAAIAKKLGLPTINSIANNAI